MSNRYGPLTPCVLRASEQSDGQPQQGGDDAQPDDQSDDPQVRRGVGTPGPLAAEDKERAGKAA